MKVLRNTLIVAVLTVLAVIAVKIALSGPVEVSPSPEAVATRPAKAEPSPEAKPAAPAPPSVPPMLASPGTPVNLPEDEGEHGEFTTSTDILKQRLFKKEPKLAQFDYFREHVLLDSVTREDYRKLLADKAMLAKVRNDLLHPTDRKDTTESNVKRLMEIDYLREAMDWKEHPGRKDMLAEVEKIILEDSFTADMPADVKRSLAATKLELYEIYSAQAPERALALVDEARGTRLEKMLEYFAEHNQRRLAKERELSLQAQNQTSKP
jgi:hypothetical protein